jgi:N-acetylgalactosamine kinase
MPALKQLRHLIENAAGSSKAGVVAEEIIRTYQCDGAEVPKHATRLLGMIKLFEAQYPDAVDVRFFRAPGRVNLIGEHTDYNGYPVLPMAIDRDITALVAPARSSTIEICNTDSTYTARSFALCASIEPFAQGDWGNYVKASLQGLIAEGLLPTGARGFRAVFDGNVPDSAGLSSSAALVVVSALAALAANNVTVEPLHLAEVLARAERYVGTEGGGMDQAASLLGRAGNALKIDFFPLQIEPVPFPEEYAIVVSNSMVRATKSAGARDHYNRRVVECRFAAALGAQAASRRLGRKVETSLLSDLESRKLGMPEHVIDQLVRDEAGEKPLMMEDLSRKLGDSASNLRERYCRLRNGSLFDGPKEGMMVWKRYRHVVTEARRVGQARDALKGGAIDLFGQLMFQSHESCRDDYEVSCAELETLVSLARILKATGSRLTGAGFGGCTVSLVRKEDASEFARELWHRYSATLPAGALPEFKDAVFISGPAQGAGELFASL